MSVGWQIWPGLLALALSLPVTAQALPAEPEAATQLPEVPPVTEGEPDPARRTSFDLTTEDGGRITGSAGSLRVESDPEGGAGRAFLAGGVEIFHQDVKITADEISLDLETEQVVAKGDVVFDQGPRRMTGSRLEFDLEQKIGEMLDVSGFVSTAYFFTGDSVSKTGDNTYRIENGMFSSCEGEVPAWSFRAKKIDVTVDGYAKARGATLRIKKAPIFYVPYILFPVETDRTSGFLMPKPGYSSRRGPSFSLAYYQTLGRSYDTTFNLELFGGGTPEGALGSGSFLAFGNELRYRPSEGTQGLLETYFIRDPEVDDLRWKVELTHESRDLPLGFRGVIRIDDVSDFDFFQDFERRGDRNSRRQLYSNAFLTKNWGPNSLNIQFDSRENRIGPDRSVELRQLPEIEYKLRPSRLGRTPLYLQLKSSVHFLDIDRSQTLKASYGRADVFPELTLPIRARPWMSLSFTAGGRFTWWGDSLATGQELTSSSESQFRGDSLTRFSPTARAEIVGPSFSRIFGGGERRARFKHVIEPRFNFVFIDEFEDESRIPIFDEIDNLRGTNVGRFSFINRLLAKPPGEHGGGAREVLSLELFQDVSFDADRPLRFSRDRTREGRQGPITGLLRFNPSSRTLLRTKVAYNTLFSEIETTELSGTLGLGKSSNVGLRWARRVNAEDGRPRSDQLRLSARFPLIPRRLTFAGQTDYDIERGLLQLQRYLLSFRGSCYTLTFELGDYRRGNRRDRQFRFLVTLKNIGTFLDITGGETETL